MIDNIYLTMVRELSSLQSTNLKVKREDRVHSRQEERLTTLTKEVILETTEIKGLLEGLEIRKEKSQEV